MDAAGAPSPNNASLVGVGSGSSNGRSRALAPSSQRSPSGGGGGGGGGGGSRIARPPLDLVLIGDDREMEDRSNSRGPISPTLPCLSPPSAGRGLLPSFPSTGKRNFPYIRYSEGGGGPSPSTGTDPSLFASRAVAAASTVLITVQSIIVRGYAVERDCAPHCYGRVSAAPTYPGVTFVGSAANLP